MNKNICDGCKYYNVKFSNQICSVREPIRVLIESNNISIAKILPEKSNSKDVFLVWRNNDLKAFPKIATYSHGFFSELNSDLVIDEVTDWLRIKLEDLVKYVDKISGERITFTTTAELLKKGLKDGINNPKQETVMDVIKKYILGEF